MADKEIAVLTAVLANFDSLVDPVKQSIPVTFHRYTDGNFPPIADLPPRFQYRIPKLWGWQMFPGYDYYIWLDGGVSLIHKDSAKWLMDQLGHAEVAFFRHPYRTSIKDEVQHVDDYLNRRKGTKRGQDYLIHRYKNGLHNEQYKDILLDKEYIDDILYASTAFIYKDTEKIRDFFRLWWLHQSRYFTVDQIVLPYLIWKHDLDINVIEENPFKSKYIKQVSKHR